MAEPLAPEARCDLETVVAVAGRLLKKVEDGALGVLDLMPDVMALDGAHARLEALRLWSALGPEREDAPKRWREDAGRARGSEKGAAKRRRATRAEVEAEVREALAHSPGLSWTAACDRAAARLRLSGRHVRTVMRDSPLRAGAGRHRPETA